MSIFGIFFLFACGSKSTDTAESTDTSEPMDTAETTETETETETETNDEAVIFGNTFTLSGTEGTVETDSTLSLAFYSNGDSMSIGGLCNDIFGDVSFGNGVMSFTYGGSTDLECSEEESQETNWVIGFLEGEPLYEYDGNTLELEGAEATLTFEKNVTEE